MSKWIDKFLKKESMNRTDRTDKPTDEGHLSALSVTPEGVLDQNLKNISRKITDNTDRFKMDANISDLSGSSQDVFERIDFSYGEHAYEERISIAQIDGYQNSLQAHRIAYLDAFISILSSLVEDDPHQGWLAQKIQIALATLEVRIPVNSNTESGFIRTENPVQTEHRFRFYSNAESGAIRIRTEEKQCSL